MSHTSASNDAHQLSGYHTFNILERIPIPDQYYESKPETQKLIAPPFLLRLSFLVDIFIAGAIFVYCMYYTLVDTITITKISFESLSDWDCNVLSPRNDGVSLSSKSSEVVEFSSARMSLDQCYSWLGSTGYDVCSSSSRVDTILRYAAVPSSSDNCLSVMLPNNNRLCKGTSTYDDVEDFESFQTHASYSSFDIIGSDGNMILSNSSTSLKIFSSVSMNTFSEGLLSDVIAVGQTMVAYVTQSGGTGGQPKVYVLNIFDYTQDILETAVVPDTFNNIAGLASDLSGGQISVFTLNENPFSGSLFTYYISSKTSTTASDISFDQYSYYSSDATGSDYMRYISYGDDGYLYIICTTYATLEVGGPGGVTSLKFPIIRFDVTSSIIVNVFYVNFAAASLTANGKSVVMTYVQQVVVADNFAYAYSGASTGSILVKIDLSLQPTAQPTTLPTSSPTIPVNNGPPIPQTILSTLTPTAEPSSAPTPAHSSSPTASPTASPSQTAAPTATPTDLPTASPSSLSATTLPPTAVHTNSPTPMLTFPPSTNPTTPPSALPTVSPTAIHTGPPPALIRRQLQISERRLQDTNVVAQPIANCTQFSAEPTAQAYVTLTNIETDKSTGTVIYLYSGNDNLRQIFIPQSDSIEMIFPLSTETYPFAVEIGYYYGLCNGKTGNYSVSADLLTDFSNQCDDINGIYYRNNEYHELPSTCITQIATEGYDSLFNCSDFVTSYETYIATNCEASIATVCKYEYTKNPPYYCTQSRSQNVLTVLSTAFANAGAFRSIWVVLVVFCLGRLFPDGFEDFVKDKLHRAQQAVTNQATNLHGAIHDSLAHSKEQLEEGLAQTRQNLAKAGHQFANAIGTNDTVPDNRLMMDVTPTQTPHNNNKVLNKVHVEPFVDTV